MHKRPYRTERHEGAFRISYLHKNAYCWTNIKYESELVAETIRGKIVIDSITLLCTVKE